MAGQNFRGFTERVALVTGGAMGIGRAVALQLALEGAFVIVQHAPGDAEGAAVARELLDLGTLARTVAADVSKVEEVRRMLKAVDEMYGRLDLLVNAQSISRALALEELTEGAWDEALDGSLKGAFLCAQAAVPLMRGRPASAIVNIAAAAGMSGRGGGAANVAAQAGIIGLTKWLAVELAPRIRVNCVVVGGVNAPCEVAARHAAGEDAGPAAVANQTAFADPPAADEVARACLYLLSSDARSITGETLVVGGLR